VQARSAAPFNVSYEYPDLQTQLSTMTGWRRQHAGAWRLPSIEEALGVPSILRCVTLISNTTGQLTVRGYRDGAPMDDSPRIITRPDPWTTPQVFYRDSAYNMATRGEVVWYIASRDNDGLASALVVVPLRELTIEQNPRDRLRAEYRWGNGTGGSCM
jgi:phage portal protein BeeE